MKKKRRVFRWIAWLLVLFAVYMGVGIVRSLFLESSHVTLTLPSRTGQTGLVRVVQVSDLHRAVFGENNQKLVDLVAQKRPDLIVATGDMIDVHTPDILDTVDLFRRFCAVAPVVYSLGNHEADRADVYDLIAALENVGVKVVSGDAVDIPVGTLTMRVGGIYRAERLYELRDDGQIDILLCHFPDKIAFFAGYGIPLTFAGHTHGGQFRIPVLDIPLYAPGQGWFPEYTAGLYEKDGSFLIVSRGLGNSSFPFRSHNPPEIVVADITYVN